MNLANIPRPAPPAWKPAANNANRFLYTTIFCNYEREINRLRGVFHNPL